jgi:lipopolysaccharide/colanic/teichoic acid biosynthesis glycosyltransferase
MISERSNGLYWIFVGSQIALVELFYWVFFNIYKISFKTVGMLPEKYFIYSSVIAVSLVIHAAWEYGSSINKMVSCCMHPWRRSFYQIIFMSGLFFVFLVASKDTSISRGFLFLLLLLAYGLLAVCQGVLGNLLSRVLFGKYRQIKTVFLGDRFGEDKVIGWLKNRGFLGVDVVAKIPVGCIDESGSEIDIESILGILENVLVEKNINQVVVSLRDLSSRVVRPLVRICDAKGVRITFHVEPRAAFGSSASFSEVDGFCFVTYQSEPLENPINRVMKRGLDLLISIPVVLFVLPVLTLFVWFFQNAESPGPIFFLQRRCGINKGVFKIIKYRTMHVGGFDSAIQAKINDARVFKHGKWLRKTSIDEFPQFINVFLGNMSIVGPRPHLEEHDLRWESCLDQYRKRSYVKPGITGLAQIRGFRGEAKTDLDIRLRAMSDLEYIQKWTIGLDIMIVFKTAVQVFLPPKSAV